LVLEKPRPLVELLLRGVLALADEDVHARRLVWKKTASSSPDATGSPGATIVLGSPLRHCPVAVVS
jgi:hypothetical protein